MKIPSDVFCHPYNMNVVLQVFLAYNTFLMNVFLTYLTWVFWIQRLRKLLDVLSVPYSMNVIFAYNAFLLMNVFFIVSYSIVRIHPNPLKLGCIWWPEVNIKFKILHFRFLMNVFILKWLCKIRKLYSWMYLTFCNFLLVDLGFWVVLCFVQSLVTTCYAPGLVNNSNLFCHGHKGGWRDGEKQ